MKQDDSRKSRLDELMRRVPKENLLETPHENLAAAFDHRRKRGGNKSNDVRQKIRHLMVTTDMTYEEIGEEVGLSGMTVYHHVKKMIDLRGK